MQTTTPAPLHEDPDVHRRRWLTLGVMCLSLVLVVMAVSSLNVAVPSMQQHLDASATQVHWIIDSYAIVFAGLLLPAGALGDRYGRKGALLVGLGIFALGLVTSGIAESAGQVIAGRAIMGAGAAFVMPATLSLITAVFPPNERPKAIAMWAGFAGAGGAIGPIVSGALLENFWWGSALLVNLPVVALAATAIAFVAPRSRDSQETPLDPIGSGLSLTGVVALLYGIIEGAERGWTDGLVLAAFAAAVVLLAGFITWERRTTNPMLPMHLFRDRRLSVGSAVVTLTFFVLFGFFLLLSLYLQYVRGYSALNTGLAMLPMPISMIAVSPRSAALSERFGIGRVIVGGFAAIAVGMLVLATVTPTTPYIVLAVAFALLGGGLGGAAAPATGLIMSAVPLDKAGVGSAVNDTTRELGGALGIAMLGSLVSSLYRSRADFDGLDVSPEQAEAAEESIGAAVGVAQELPAGGGQLLQEAQSAFTDAFQVSNGVSVVIAVGVGIMVWATLGRRSQARPSPAPAADPLEALEEQADGRAKALAT